MQVEPQGYYADFNSADVAWNQKPKEGKVQDYPTTL